MTSTFESDGFLSDEMEDIRKTIAERFPRTFSKVYEVNAFAHKYWNSIQLENSNTLHLVLVCLLERILDSFQSVVHLMSMGLENDSDTITRSSVEAMFYVRKLTSDDEYLESYLATDPKQRKKIMTLVKNNPQNILSGIFNKLEVDDILNGIEQELKQLNIKNKSIETIAREVGLDDWYQLEYRNLSNETHIAPRTLEKFIVGDNSDEDVLFNFNPRCDRLPAILITQCSIILHVLEDVEQIFQLGFEESIEQFFADIKSFNE